MLAESFWTSDTAQFVLAGLVALVAFLLAWFLLGTAARAKKDRDVEARMRAVIQPGQQPSGATAEVKPGSGWIPNQVTKFGTRFAEARGFSDRLDSELDAAGVSLRSGEFVVASVAAAVVFGVLGAALLQKRAPGPGHRSRRRGLPDDAPAERVVASYGQAAGAASRRPDDHGVVPACRAQLPPVAGHGGQGDHAARCGGVPAGRGRDPSRPARGGCPRGARRSGRERRLQVGRARGEHPARGRREPRRDPRQRGGHAAGASDAQDGRSRSSPPRAAFPPGCSRSCPSRSVSTCSRRTPTTSVSCSPRRSDG